MGQAVFGLLVGNVFAKVVNQFAVGAVGFGHGLAAEGLVLSLVPVPAGELLERPFGMVGLGDNVVVSGLFAQDFAAGLFGNHLNVLMVDVLASQLFAAVLVGGDAGHDGFGGQGIVCLRWPNDRQRARGARSGGASPWDAWDYVRKSQAKVQSSLAECGASLRWAGEGARPYVSEF